jgi:hypothetical protein
VFTYVHAYVHGTFSGIIVILGLIDFSLAIYQRCQFDEFVSAVVRVAR